MIESGSMLVTFSPLFQNRRCKNGDLLLVLGTINGSSLAQANHPIGDAIADARFKLDELIASRSPVEAEIAFLNQWLGIAEAADSPSVTPLETTPVDTPIKDDKAPQEVPISKVEFSDLVVSNNIEDYETFTRK